MINKIKEAVEQSKIYPDPTIEYNFDKLPKHKEVKKDSFFGVRAVYNDKVKKDTAKVVFKYG